MLPTPPPSPQLSTCLSPEDRLGCILANRLELISILGVGAYGVVYQAVDIYTNELYAVKALPKHGLDPRQQRFQRGEIAMHYQASQHPNVVSLMRILDSPDCTFVVIEYCPEGDLFSNITERGRFVGDDRLAKHVFLQLLDAVQFCHSLGIYHRDLKPENVLVTDDCHTVKLADFGLATTDKVTTDFGCGSTFYMSPGKHATPLGTTIATTNSCSRMPAPIFAFLWLLRIGT
jgi:serine/threonine protein kinase